jgi:ribonucleotide reductase alpha subunit
LARVRAGAVYLHAHHPDILRFLDTKRENADEKIRIKTLSLGVVIPDITFRLAKENAEMALFSPYDVERLYGKPFGDMAVSEMYDSWLPTIAYARNTSTPAISSRRWPKSSSNPAIRTSCLKIR